MLYSDSSSLNSRPSKQALQIRDILVGRLKSYLISEEATQDYSRFHNLVHENFWSDYGWDIVQGPGQAIAYANSLAERVVLALPDAILVLLWWQTVAGSVEASLFCKYLDEEKCASFEDFIANIPMLLDEDDDRVEIVVNNLLEPIRHKAEADFAALE